MNSWFLEEWFKRGRNYFAHGDARAPYSFDIELSHGCTRRCGYCPVTLHPRPDAVMSDEVLDIVLKRLAEYGWHGAVGVCRFSEPLRIPNLAERIRKIQKSLNGCKIRLFTNGDLLEPGLCRELLKAGVHHFIVGRHPPEDSSLYRFIDRTMIGGKVGVLLGYPGAYRIRYHHIHHWVNRGGSVPESKLPGPAFHYPGYCPETQMLGITLDAKLVLCYNDFHGEEVLGDLRTQTIQECYYSPERIKQRALLRKGIPTCDLCRKCMGLVPNESGQARREQPKT